MTESEMVHSILRQAEGEARRLHADRLTRVRCRLGFHSQLDEHLIRDIFSRWRRGTPCDQAELLVEQLPPYALCPRHRELLARAGLGATLTDRCPYCSHEANEMVGSEWKLVGVEADRQQPAE